MFSIKSFLSIKFGYIVPILEWILCVKVHRNIFGSASALALGYACNIYLLAQWISIKLRQLLSVMVENWCKTISDAIKWTVILNATQTFNAGSCINWSTFSSIWIVVKWMEKGSGWCKKNKVELKQQISLEFITLLHRQTAIKRLKR